MHKGSCLCGAVRFTVEGDLPAPVACHCTQCRKQTGHYEVSTDVPRHTLSIEGEEHLTWYFSSEAVRRGFCSICGSSLFWDPVQLDWIGVSMGAVDNADPHSARHPCSCRREGRLLRHRRWPAAKSALGTANP